MRRKLHGLEQDQHLLTCLVAMLGGEDSEQVRRILGMIRSTASLDEIRARLCDEWGTSADPLDSTDRA